jgi:hypothetical protein
MALTQHFPPSGPSRPLFPAKSKFLTGKCAGHALIAFFCLIVSGCAYKTFTPYSGVQFDWPRSAGSFVSNHDGFLIYKGLPDKPYTLLGELAVEQYPQYMNTSIASAGKKYQADAAMIVSNQTINGGSMALGGGGSTFFQSQAQITPAYGSGFSATQSGTSTTYTNPTISTNLSWDKTTVYLIKFKR